MAFNAIEHIEIPNGSLAAQAFKKIDYGDAYRIPLPADAPQDIDHLFQTLFSVPSSSWLGRLMALRNTLARLVGLKAVVPQDKNLPLRPLQAGDQTKFMKVYQRSANELLMGEDDRHLDVRVSVLRQEHDNRSWLVLTTVVQFNNWFGRLYFLPVRPFHQRIVPWMLKRAFQSPVMQPEAAKQTI